MQLNQDYFTLFDLTPGFDIDLAALKTQYYQRLKQCHPDLFTDQTADQQAAAQQATSWVNKAYRTLLDPFQRAVYLLQRRGIDIMGEQQTSLPPALLMAQMEYRERLETLREQTNPDLTDFKQEITAKINALMAELQQLDFEQESEDNLKHHFWKLSFYRKLLRDITG